MTTLNLQTPALWRIGFDRGHYLCLRPKDLLWLFVEARLSPVSQNNHHLQGLFRVSTWTGTF